MTKVLVATPAYGDIFYTPYVTSVIKLIRLFNQRGWDFSFRSISYSEISESRNYLVTQWYDKGDATHILFLDADMGFEPGLIAEMVELNKPIVGVVYPKRALDIKRAVEFGAAGDSADRAVTKAQDFVIRPLRGARVDPGHPGFIQVEACGSGILLIQRVCIATMLERLPEISDAAAKRASPLAKDLDRLIRAFDELKVDGLRMSEDFSFCHRWRHGCAGEIWANISHEIVHVGLHQFKGRYLDKAPVAPRIVVGRQQAKVVTGRLSMPTSRTPKK